MKRTLVEYVGIRFLYDVTGDTTYEIIRNEIIDERRARASFACERFGVNRAAGGARSTGENYCENGVLDATYKVEWIGKKANAKIRALVRATAVR